MLVFRSARMPSACLFLRAALKTERPYGVSPRFHPYVLASCSGVFWRPGLSDEDHILRLHDFVYV